MISAKNALMLKYCTTNEMLLEILQKGHCVYHITEILPTLKSVEPG